MKSQRIDIGAILRKYGILIVLIAICIFFSIAASPVFLKKTNIINIVRQVSTLGICAVGMTCVILTGGIDISVGSVVGLGSMLCASFMVDMSLHPVIAVILTLIVTAAIGLFNGFCINRLYIPPIITTLGMMGLLRGVVYLLCRGLPISGFTEDFKFLGQGYIWMIPFPVIVMIVVFVFGHFFLNRSKYGRYTYGLGGNEEATRLSGVNVRKQKYLLYMISSLCAGIAGVIMLSRLNSGQPTTGTGLEMQVVTAVVLGGISINGGEGKLMGVVFGVLIIGVLQNGLILLSVSSYWQMVIQGAVLLFAVAFDGATKRSQKKEKVIALEAA